MHIIRDKLPAITTAETAKGKNINDSENIQNKGQQMTEKISNHSFTSDILSYLEQIPSYWSLLDKFTAIFFLSIRFHVQYTKLQYTSLQLSHSYCSSSALRFFFRKYDGQKKVNTHKMPRIYDHVFVVAV